MRAMILCAGYGTRLGDLTRDVPKPMLLLQGRPLLEYVICNLARHSFDQIAINLHFLPDQILSYFGNGSRWNVELTYSYEPELLGTAGGIKNMAGFLSHGDAFLVHYGDILTDQDFTSMLLFHRERRSQATLLVHRSLHSNSIVNLDAQGHIIGFLERPTEAARRGENSPWVNSGICICDPMMLDEIPAIAHYDLPRDIFPRLVARGGMNGFLLSGYRCAIDSPERLAEARSALSEGRCQDFHYT